MGFDDVNHDVQADFDLVLGRNERGHHPKNVTVPSARPGDDAPFVTLLVDRFHDLFVGIVVFRPELRPDEESLSSNFGQVRMVGFPKSGSDRPAESLATGQEVVGGDVLDRGDRDVSV